MKYIDIHSHLDICKNIPKIIENFKNGIILTVGVNSKTNKKALLLSKKYKNVEACLGGYPSDLLKLKDEEIDNEIKFIKENKEKIIEISEIGLDLKENSNDTLEKQKENLGKFVNLAKSLNLPIIVHSRYAEFETIEFLEKFDYKKIIMHCFSGNMKLVKRIIENKWFLSIPANVKNSKHFQKIIEITPIENLFCETDSPFLHPDKLRNNEPKNVEVSYKKIAEIKNLKLNEVKNKIYKNYKRIFY